ncbi:MAG TPA: phage holin family protein [Thermoanaerobaculia bacterium]|nr:phage holin family protein [Thermoanaerobaculia bacterium]
MSVERAELPGEDEERSWRERLSEAAAAGRVLVATRLEIFREEAAAKAIFAAKGLAGLVVAAALAVGALLLAAALIAAVLIRLTNSLVWGILLAVVLYGAGAAAAAWFGWRSLSKVRPFEFPAVTAEIAQDAAAISEALAPPEQWEEAAPASGDDADVADLEDRLRRGSE